MFCSHQANQTNDPSILQPHQNNKLPFSRICYNITVRARTRKTYVDKSILRCHTSALHRKTHHSKQSTLMYNKKK